MLSPVEFKERYHHEWASSNARERFVLLFLRTFLPGWFKPEFVGLGAGSSEYIPRTYRGALEAFDIAIRAEGGIVAFIEVTGIDYRKKPKKGIGYCVGEWKIDKAYKHRIQDRTWVAFVLEAQSRILWAPITKFNTSKAFRAKVYEDEDYHRCMHAKDWHPFYRPDWDGRGKIPFLNWLRLKAATEGPLVLKASRG